MNLTCRLPLISAPIALMILTVQTSAASSHGIRGSVPPGLILSEAMADPTAVQDAQGEFLELGNTGGDTLRFDSLRLDADAQSLLLSRLTIAPGAAFLLCRDSLPTANGGMLCHGRWAALSLANARPVNVALSGAGWRNEYSLPASRPGVSWENTWDAGEGFRVFAPSSYSWSAGDSATPGFRNSRSAIRPDCDLGIVDVTMADGYLAVRVAKRGTGAAPASHLSLRLDANWDGEAETLMDSVPVDLSAAGEAVLRCGAGAGVRGIVHARLTRDEDPSNDLYLLPVEPGRPLAITEWRPAPEAGEPEWVEIRNRTADSGGFGRRLDLARAAFNGLALGSKAGTLEPGGFLVLTESLERFRARFGPIKARALQPAGWKTLRNTGDTLVLSLAGITVDSLVYGAVSAAAIRAGATPGFASPADVAEGWSISGRVAGAGRTLDVEVRTVSGRSYFLRVFDLEGNRVRDLGGGGAGRKRHSWDGRGDGGAVLVPGPYILCLSRDGSGSRRAAVIVMGEP